MIFDGNLEVASAAAQRWQKRTAQREQHRGKPAAEVESRERIQARLDRLGEAATSGMTSANLGEAALPTPEVLSTMGLERIVGQRDFQGIAFLEVALAVSRFVGRINIRSSATRGAGFGTGFMVSPKLLLTNNHVLPHEAMAKFSEVEFDYQNDRFGRPLPVVPFGLRPDLFFMTDKDLDFSLVAVADRSRLETPLKHYGWSRLIGMQGKILIGEHLNIIQHPRGQFKQFVSRSNELVDLFDDFLHYVTDTEPGSSGSPVYNDQWEVVGLHHSGVPRKENGKLIGKDGKPWSGRDPEDIDWVANEGIRVSSLVRHIEAQRLDRERGALRDELLNLEPPNPLEAARIAEAEAAEPPMSKRPTPGRASQARAQPSHADQSGAFTVIVPLRISVEVGRPLLPDVPEQHGIDTTKPAVFPQAPTGGLGIALGTSPRPQEAPVRDLNSALLAIAALDWRMALHEHEMTEASFGSYEGLPARIELLPDGRRAKLLSALTYIGPDGLPWPVDAGVTVDGASIPRAFWTLIGGPFEGRYRDASIVHDRYCDLRIKPWRDTHRMFHDAMRCSLVPSMKARVMFYAVYRFGPRWQLGQGAGAETFATGREPTNADAETLLADVKTIYELDLGIM